MDWNETLRLIPGYDPFATAVDSWFDAAAADRAIGFIEVCLRHVEGAKAGTPFILEPWQRAWYGNLFGWKKKDAFGRLVRRYRESFLYVPRKNGKTPGAAALALYVLFCDDELGQQNYIAAGDREQAGMLFRQCKGMVEQEPELSRRCRVYGGQAAAGQSKSIVIESELSYLRVISADADTKHGGNTHLAIIDELHVQPNRDLVDVLTTSMASANRKQPLLVYITTADHARQSICNEKYEYACTVRDNGGDPAKPGYDPSFLPVIYEAKPDDSWEEEATWRKANPNLGVSVSLEYLRRECKRAKEIPAYQNTFRRLHLNQRTEQDVRAIDMESWQKCGAVPVDPAELEGEECYAGLDLSSTTDLSAFVLFFPREKGGVALPFFWVPGENAKSREDRDRVPYREWARLGSVRMTEGNVIDYDVIRRDINDLQKIYNIREIAADRWNATQLINNLQADGFQVIAFGQGFRDMTAPTKELLRLVADGCLFHGGHPVLTWNARNVATETDAAGNLKPSKKRSTERIDGIVALIMAIGRRISTANLGSIYDGRGIEVLD